MTRLIKWWKERSPYMKFIYGFIAGMIIIFVILTVKDSSQGLRIDNTYIKAVKPCEINVNDIYVNNMVDFVDTCSNVVVLKKFVDVRGRLHGITLWCSANSTSFTFFYSDKWRKEYYGNLRR